MELRTAVIAALVASFCVGSRARAQEDDYRAAIEEAVEEFDAGRFEEARALFERAHELSPNARTLRGIGLTSFELRDYVVAYRSFSAALTNETRPLTDAQRAEVGTLLDRSRRFVGRYRIESTPSQIALQVGARDVELEPDGSLLLPLGEQTITASAPGYERMERAILVRGGEDETLTFALLARGATSGGIETPAEPPHAASVHADVTAPTIVLAVGGALAVASIVTGAAWWGYQEAQVSRCAPPAVCDNLDETRTARDAAMGTTISLAVVGAGVLVAGAVLLATTSSGSESAVAFACAPSPLGAVCAGRF